MPKPDLNTIRISRIFRAIRSELGINQTQTCELLDLTQGAFSKIESASINPSLYHWLTFAQSFGLSPYCFKDGFIDRSDIKKTPIKGDASKWKIAKKYIESDITARSLIPILESLRAELGDEEIDELLYKVGVAPEYFVIRDNKISLLFVADFFDEVSKLKKLTRTNILKLTSKASDKAIMGKIFAKASDKNPIKTGVNVLKGMPRLESFSKYTTSGQTSKSVKVEQVFGDNLSKYDKETIKKLERYLPPLYQGIIVNTAKAYGANVEIEKSKGKLASGKSWNFTLKAV